MASIVENKNVENHKVQLKDKPTNVALFRKEVIDLVKLSF